MTDIVQTQSADLPRAVELTIQNKRGQREPLALHYVAVLLIIALCLGMFWVEFENLTLALRQLFETSRDGSSDLDGAHTLAFASIGAILCGDVMMASASRHWSERTRHRVDLAGIAALAVFGGGMMILIPTGIWSANETSQDGAGGAVSQGSYLAFSAMLAALFPLALFSNFLLIQKLKAAFAKIVLGRGIDGQIRRLRRTLAKREATQAALREVEQQQAHAPTDARIAEEHAAWAADIIGNVAGELSRTLDARLAGSGSADAPLIASDARRICKSPDRRMA